MPLDPNLIMIVLLAALLIFMFWNSRKRMAKMKAEQEAKARQTVPGAEVMLNGGLFGTIVSFDPDDLNEPALIEIAPGVVVKVHSQAIARVVTPEDDADEHGADDADHEAPLDVTAEVPEDASSLIDPTAEPKVESVEETRKRLEGDDKQA